MRHAWLGLGALGLCACNAILGIGDFTIAGDGGVSDGDGGPPGDGSQVCLGTLVTACVEPTGSDMILGGFLDTDADCIQVIQSDAGDEICVISADVISVGMDLRVTGSRPLMLVSIGDLTVLGSAVDVSSRTGAGGSIGAGANSAACNIVPGGSADGMGGGGGGGGGFGGPGGSGGTGGAGASGALGGSAQAATTLRGGCGGSKGGVGFNNASGAGGAGGGAIFLVAGGTFTLDSNSAVFASGGGGAAGSSNGAGGGGGSGGMVALEAAQLVLDGIIAANGGGGGGGAASGVAGAGGSGTTNNFTAVATGGLSEDAMKGGNGGAGTALVDTAGSPGAAAATGGGGGGGGGIGVLKLRGNIMTGLSSSPTPTP